MGWEIYEDRMVVRDGTVPNQDHSKHYALVEGDGVLRIEHVGVGPQGFLRLAVYRANEEGKVGVVVSDLNDAVGALRRLHGFDAPLPQFEEVRERSAAVVERSCELLEERGDLGHTMAAQLRATMLQLIDVATSEDRARSELESGETGLRGEPRAFQDD